MGNFFDKKIFGISVVRILTLLGSLLASTLLWLIVRYLDANPDTSSAIIGCFRGLL